MSKERPIIFNTEMVKAILEGRNTQTRRPIKPHPVYEFKCLKEGLGYPASEGNLYAGFYDEGTSGMYVKCPFGRIGDRLWVRETFFIQPIWEKLNDDSISRTRIKDKPYYKADYFDKVQRPLKDNEYIKKWKPSIHMPRWASRITLEIIDVRVERLEDIGWDDYEKEGVRRTYGGDPYINFPNASFYKLWNSIYSKTEDKWSNNPWVWVVEFRRVL